MITNGFSQSTIDRAQFPIQINPNDPPTIRTMEVFQINFTPIDVREPSKRELSENCVAINASNEIIMDGKVYHVDEDRPTSDLLSLLRIVNRTAAKKASKTEARLRDLESSVSHLTLRASQELIPQEKLRESLRIQSRVRNLEINQKTISGDSHTEPRFKSLETRMSKLETDFCDRLTKIEENYLQSKIAFDHELEGYRNDYDNVICRLKDLTKNIGGLQKQLNTLKSSHDSVKTEIGEVTSKAESLLRLSESKIEKLNLLHGIGENKISNIEREVRSLDQLVQYTASNNTVLNPTQGTHPLKSTKNTGVTSNVLAFKFKVDSSLKMEDLLAVRDELKIAVPLKFKIITKGKKFNTYFVEFKNTTSGKTALASIRDTITNFDWKSTSDCPTTVKPWYGQAPSLTSSDTSYGDINLVLEKKNSTSDKADDLTLEE